MVGLFRGKLDRFDVHIKTIEGVNQQTILGAILTIISTLVIIVLIFSETSRYMTKDVVSRMLTDTHQSQESVKIVLDIDFPYLHCDRLSYSQEITRGSVHVADSGQNFVKTPIPIGVNQTNSDNCRVFCETMTDKVAGTIKLSISHPAVPDDFVTVPFEQPDLTHKINSLAFLPLSSKAAKESDIPGLSHNPLKGQTAVGTGVGIYQYAMQIVPTQYKNLNEEVSTAHQYSVTERQVKLEAALRGVIISSQAYKDFVGILITYDFYPVAF
jgi:hypothetical protein